MIPKRVCAVVHITTTINAPENQWDVLYAKNNNLRTKRNDNKKNCLNKIYFKIFPRNMHTLTHFMWLLNIKNRNSLNCDRNNNNDEQNEQKSVFFLFYRIFVGRKSSDLFFHLAGYVYHGIYCNIYRIYDSRQTRHR